MEGLTHRAFRWLMEGLTQSLQVANGRLTLAIDYQF